MKKSVKMKNEFYSNALNNRHKNALTLRLCVSTFKTVTIFV